MVKSPWGASRALAGSISLNYPSLRDFAAGGGTPLPRGPPFLRTGPWFDRGSVSEIVWIFVGVLSSAVAISSRTDAEAWAVPGSRYDSGSEESWFEPRRGNLKAGQRLWRVRPFSFRGECVSSGPAEVDVARLRGE